jgi:hypothetical protein
VLLLKTVLLESEWALRSRYGLERGHIATFFQNLALAGKTEQLLGVSVHLA